MYHLYASCQCHEWTKWVIQAFWKVLKSSKILTPMQVPQHTFPTLYMSISTNYMGIICICRLMYTFWRTPVIHRGGLLYIEEASYTSAVWWCGLDTDGNVERSHLLLDGHLEMVQYCTMPFIHKGCLLYIEEASSSCFSVDHAKIRLILRWPSGGHVFGRAWLTDNIYILLVCLLICYRL